MTQRSTSFIASRRSVLQCAAASLAIIPIAMKAAAAQTARGTVALADLVGADGRPTEQARAWDGRSVTLRGYPAPVAGNAPTWLSLTGSPAAPCQLCGSMHDAGPALIVESTEPLPATVSMLSMVEATGTLAVASAGEVRLVDAAVRLV